jgi:hypothetical protein
MVFKLALITQAAEIKDQSISVKADNLETLQEGEEVKFYGNVLIYFKDYLLKSESVIIHFVNIDGQRKIDKANVPTPMQLINHQNSNDVIVGDSAIYSRVSRTLEIHGNVKIQKNNDLLVVNKLVLNLKK